MQKVLPQGRWMQRSQPRTGGLESTVPILLARRIHRARGQLIASAKEIAEDLELEPVELSMINTLGRLGPMRMGDLAGEMVIHAASLTRRAKGLEARGLVDRKRSEQSNREVVISLTRKGRSLFSRGFRRLHDAHRAYFSVLSPAEQKTLKKLLDALSGPERPPLAEAR